LEWRLEALAVQRDFVREQHATAGSVLWAAAAVNLFALFVAFWAVGLPLDGILEIATQLNLLELISLGVLNIVALAFLAAHAGHTLRLGLLVDIRSLRMSYLLMVAGGAGVFTSIFLLGGILGIAAGALTITGGALSLRRASPFGGPALAASPRR